MTMAVRDNQKGQALVEFIVFLPFMIMLYSVVLTLGSAINGSINQQKAARSYFYFRVQNNSYVTRPIRSGAGLANTSWQSFGHYFIGWADYLEGNAPVYPCYKLNLPFAADDESCDQPYNKMTTQYIRVGTAYGACGATYMTNNALFSTIPDVGGEASLEGLLNAGSCLIQ